MAEPTSLVAALSTACASLAGVAAYLYRELKSERDARLAEEKAHSARVETLMAAQIEREHDAAERDDRLEDLVLGMREEYNRERANTPTGRTRTNTKPKNEVR